MGNVWQQKSDEKLENAQSELLRLGGVDMSRVKTGRIDLNEAGSQIKDPELNMHYIEIESKYRNDSFLSVDYFSKSNKKAPVLIMIHGFAQGAACFYPIMGELSNFYHIYSIDVIGQGYSGRPDFDLTTVSEVEEYFLKYIKLWKERVGLGDQKVTLCGHSMGGYLSILYALKNPAQVEKLILLSPAGIPEMPEDANKYTEAKKLSKGTFSKFILAQGMKCWQKGYTSQRMVRMLGMQVARPSLSMYLKSLKLSEEEHKHFLEYSLQVQVRKESSEKAVNVFFKLAAWPRSPLCKRMSILKENNIPVFQYYGEHDIIDCAQAKQMVMDGDIIGTCEIISNDDHHLKSNKRELLYKIIRDAISQEEADNFEFRYSLLKRKTSSSVNLNSQSFATISTQDL